MAIDFLLMGRVYIFYYKLAYLSILLLFLLVLIAF
jgi:hypothetical protein